jgi:riboflavin synthase
LAAKKERAMFTGIVTDMGDVLTLEQRGDLRARIGTAYDVAGIDIGASVCCDGVCLTVVDKGKANARDWMDFEISAETLSKTNLGGWALGRRVNLERSLKVGDELGGHIVSGHVDGLAEVVGLHPEGDSLRLRFRAPEALAPYIASKGSVALNGTSLTVNEVEGLEFGVNLIPHTRAVTTWGQVALGDQVNLEVDTMARYVARYMARLREFE